MDIHKKTELEGGPSHGKLPLGTAKVPASAWDKRKGSEDDPKDPKFVDWGSNLTVIAETARVSHVPSVRKLDRSVRWTRNLVAVGQKSRHVRSRGAGEARSLSVLVSRVQASVSTLPSSRLAWVHFWSPASPCEFWDPLTTFLIKPYWIEWNSEFID